ncbi:transcriptional repressor LexA [Arhodomonas sp. SL1]|uniref:transcriptional repressor LexA n=1 Tax=Arhodomonas sp. SL1 TaxID=3425691 RepID=UPI003F881FDB
MNEPTERQRQILELIRRHVAETGYPPTRGEIARAFGFRSANAAEQHLRALAAKGLIELRRGASRGIRLPAAEDDGGLPVVGRVAAGSPILAEEHIERHCAVDATLFSPRPDYLLTVRGASMEKAGILDGDLLAVHRTAEAREGQIVVARLHDEVTVKRFRRDGPFVRLLPENDVYHPIEVDLRRESLVIEGIGVGVIRPGL